MVREVVHWWESLWGNGVERERRLLLDSGKEDKGHLKHHCSSLWLLTGASGMRITC